MLLIMRDHPSLNKNIITIGRGFLNPLFHEDPPILTIPPFLHIFSNPLPPILLPLFLLPCFFGWMCDCFTSNMLFYLMIWPAYTYWALAPLYQKQLAMNFMQQDIMFTVGLTQVTWLLLALWFDITHAQTNTHRAQTGTNRL